MQVATNTQCICSNLHEQKDRWQNELAERKKRDGKENEYRKECKKINRGKSSEHQNIGAVPSGKKHN